MLMVMLVKAQSHLLVNIINSLQIKLPDSESEESTKVMEELRLMVSLKGYVEEKVDELIEGLGACVDTKIEKARLIEVKAAL